MNLSEFIAHTDRLCYTKPIKGEKEQRRDQPEHIFSKAWTLCGKYPVYLP